MLNCKTSLHIQGIQLVIRLPAILVQRRDLDLVQIRLVKARQFPSVNPTVGNVNLQLRLWPLTRDQCSKVAGHGKRDFFQSGIKVTFDRVQYRVWHLIKSNGSDNIFWSTRLSATGAFETEKKIKKCDTALWHAVIGKNLSLPVPQPTFGRKQWYALSQN